MNNLWILYFIIPSKSSLTLFCWDIHQFVFLIWIQVRNLSFSAHLFTSLFWTRLHRIKTSVWFAQTVVSSVYHDEIFASNSNFFFTFCRLTCETKSHHSLTSRNFNLGWNSPPYNPPLIWSFLHKISNSFSKRLLLRCLSGFRMRLYCVRYNYLPVNFPT